MRVIQWNTHHGGKGSDGRLDVARFGEALAALQPDVVCLNEVEQHDGYGTDAAHPHGLDLIEIYRQRLGAVEAVGVHANGKLVTAGSSGISNAILSRWPIAGVQIKGLPGNRAAIAGVVNGVTIVATHLDNATAQTRALQVGTLTAWPILSRALLVLCGDWNAAPGAPELQPLVSTFEDAWFVASASKVATAFNGTGATKSRRIDAIFSRGLTITRATVPDTRIAGVFPSDHHPLVVEFAWCPRPPTEAAL